MPLFPQKTKKILYIPTDSYQSLLIYHRKRPTGMHPSLVWQLPCPSPQETAQCCRHSPIHHLPQHLPVTINSIYTSHNYGNTANIIMEPSHTLVSPCSQSRRYKSLKYILPGFKNTSFPTDIRFLNGPLINQGSRPNLPRCSPCTLYLSVIVAAILYSAFSFVFT